MQGRDIEDADGWARAWSERPTTRPEAAATLADRVAGISATATGAGDAIRVTVGSTGAITDLALDERVQRIPGPRLAQEILRVMREAQASLTAEVAAAVEDTVGGESETGRAVLDSFSSRFPSPRTERAEPPEPVMPSAPPFRSFDSQPSFPARPEFPHQPSADER